MTERRRAAEAVLIALTKDGMVLLQKRKNTSWMNGWYDVPSGHVDPGESVLEAAIRELYEEVGVKVQAKDIELFHISQSDAGTNAPYTYFAFRANKWQGSPTLNEPDLAEALDFYPLNNLPKKTLPYVKKALMGIGNNEVTFAYFGGDGNERR